MKSSTFSSNSSSYWPRSKPKRGNDSVKEPRPRITSARPFDSPSRVANRWYTRTGSSELSTVTAEPSRIRWVRPAMAASTTSGADTAKSARWCSPMPMKSTPTWSASTPSSTTSRSTWAPERGRPSASTVTSPKVSRPNSSGLLVPSMCLSVLGASIASASIDLVSIVRRRLPVGFPGTDPNVWEAPSQRGSTAGVRD